jgi:predicted phosphoribosyltransferase
MMISIGAPIYKDRTEAAEKLADRLHELQVVRETKPENGLVLGIPRGGVVTAKTVANRLGWPVAAIVTKKVGLPGQEELAVGAMGPDGSVAWNQELLNAMQLKPEELQAAVRKTEGKIESYMKKFGSQKLEVQGKTVIMVDDGAATGATMKAAVDWLRGKCTIIVGLPVCSVRAERELKMVANHLVRLETPEIFQAVGQFYEEFREVSDEEALAILNREQ